MSTSSPAPGMGPDKSTSRAVMLAMGAAVLIVGGYAAFALLGGAGVPGADADDAGLVARGKIVYADTCAACHGAKLEGQGEWRKRNPDGTLPAPPHDATGHTWHHDDEMLFNYTKKGGAAMAPPGFKSAMPGSGKDFGGTLSDADVWAVLAYIKSTWPSEIRARQKGISARVR